MGAMAALSRTYFTTPFNGWCTTWKEECREYLTINKSSMS
jgi:hypothetical protein